MKGSGSIDKYAVKTSKPKWRYRISLGKKDERGRPIYDSRGGFDKEGDAQKALRDRLTELEHKAEQPVNSVQVEPKSAPEACEPNLREWLTTWLDKYAEDTCQPKTLERYRQLARYITEPTVPEIAAIGQTPLSKLRKPQLRSAFYALRQAKGTRREHISWATVRHVVGLISPALNEAVEQELIPANPVFRLKLPVEERRNARSLSTDELHAFREACRGDWTFMLIELALAVGTRRGELLALRWSDIDWDGKTVTISKSLEQTKEGGLRIKATKGRKGKKPKVRICSLSPTTLVALQFRRAQQKEERSKFGTDYRTDLDLILCEPNGDFMQPDLVSQIIIRRMKKAGIKNASLHTLRHTHASILISRHVSLPTVSARLGHADSNITARIYSHVIEGDDQRAADTWENVVNAPVQ